MHTGRAKHGAIRVSLSGLQTWPSLKQLFRHRKLPNLKGTATANAALRAITPWCRLDIGNGEAVRICNPVRDTLNIPSKDTNMARNNKNATTGNASEATETKKARKPQDPAARKARQLSQGIARRFFAILRDAIAQGAETVTMAVAPSEDDNGMNVSTVYAALSKLITVSLGGRLERARAALEALRAVTPENSDGWIPQLVVGRVSEWSAAGGSQPLALSLTDPMLSPAEYVTVDCELNRSFKGVSVPIMDVDSGETTMVDGALFGRMDAIRFREDVAVATIADDLVTWIQLPWSQLDPRERVKAAIAQYESIVSREPDSVSANQNLDDLRTNLEALEADQSYIDRDAAIAAAANKAT